MMEAVTIPPALPRGLLLDLDDTILTYDAIGAEAWRQTCREFAPECGGLAPEDLYQGLREVRQWYWSDPDRHREGRLRLDETRTHVTLLGLQRLGLDDADLARRVSDTYAHHRDAAIGFFPGAEATLERLQAAGVRLALMTNGEAGHQRGKIDRFHLERFFPILLIEGELGFGKPDPRVYTEGLRRLDLAPEEVWAVGDNLEWDVLGPQRLGVAGIWHDYRRRGLPQDSTATPDRIIHQLAELLPD